MGSDEAYNFVFKGMFSYVFVYVWFTDLHSLKNVEGTFKPLLTKGTLSMSRVA